MDTCLTVDYKERLNTIEDSLRNFIESIRVGDGRPRQYDTFAEEKGAEHLAIIIPPYY
jgi:hypothetical protein